MGAAEALDAFRERFGREPDAGELIRFMSPPAKGEATPVEVDPDRRSCEICGKAIYGRSDRRTCSPAHQKQLQRRRVRADD